MCGGHCDAMALGGGGIAVFLNNLFQYDPSVMEWTELGRQVCLSMSRILCLCSIFLGLIECNLIPLLER